MLLRKALLFQINKLICFYSVVFISYVLRDLVPFAQFKKRAKHTWRTVTFSKVAV